MDLLGRELREADEQLRDANEKLREANEIYAYCQGLGLGSDATRILAYSRKSLAGLREYTPDNLSSEYHVSLEDARKFVGGAAKKARHDIDLHYAHEAKLAEGCFKVPFAGSAHKELHDQLVQQYCSMTRFTHYSPYCAVVQSSGVGKSRALMQLSDLGVYICYCSLASVSATAYPPRTGDLAEKLVGTSTQHGMVLYLNAWLDVLLRHIDTMSPDDWKKDQLLGYRKGGLAEMVLAKWKESDIYGSDDLYQGDKDSRADEWNMHYSEHVIKSVENALHQRFGNRTVCGVIFAFDEARGLLPSSPATLLTSPFYQIRRALRIFFEHRTFGAVMLDTSAKVSNLLPSKQNEDSARAISMGYGLAHPIYFLPNVSLFKTAARSQDDPPDCFKPEHWLKQGRPLWSAMLAIERRPVIVRGFALQKLVRTVRGDFEKNVYVNVLEGHMTQSQAMALLAATAGLSICARSELAEVMSASHMSLILRVSEDRSRIYIGLPAEPILAEGAAFALQGSVVQKGALKHLLAACQVGYVTPGPRGEFVAKFILVAAMWNSELDWQLRKMSLEEYLQRLLVSGANDQSIVNQVKENCSPEGIVFFNSFVLVRKPPTARTLKRAFTSGYALMYRAENSLPGVDIIIPVWTPKGMTCIVVSVKNLQRSGWLEKASVDKVRSEFTNVKVEEGLICITVVMSLREPNMKVSSNMLLWTSDEGLVVSDTDPYINLTCYGIDGNYSFLTGEVKELLKEVLITVPDELAGATDQEKQWIQRLLPEQYLDD